MTPQEQSMLMSLAQRVNQTQLQEKDPDADNLLGRELGANPDALYIMAQTVLVQDIALQQAKAQVTQLQQQVQQRSEAAAQQPAHATSFLGSLFGRHDSAPAAQQPPAQQSQSGQAPPYQAQPYQPGQAPAYQPVPPYQQTPYQQPGQPTYQPGQPQYYPPPAQQPQYMSAPVGQPSFMRGAMQTAAGVAAGALAFEGVESILHGFGHGGGRGDGLGGFGGGMAGMGMGPGMGMGGAFERPIEETVVNNYYGDRAGGDVHSASGMFGGEQLVDGGGEGHFHQPADQFGRVGGGDGGAQLSDAGYTVPDANYAAPEAGYNVSDANYATQSNEDVGQGGYDQNLADDSAAYDTSVDDVQIDDGDGMDDAGSGFDDNSGGDLS